VTVAEHVALEVILEAIQSRIRINAGVHERLSTQLEHAYTRGHVAGLDRAMADLRAIEALVEYIHRDERAA
jgi:hypothetical protein